MLWRSCGRNAGYIALNTGIAVGALVTLIPEVPYDRRRDVIAKMKATQKTGKQHFIIIIAEGVGHAQDLANEIQSRTGIDSRATVLGHVQRGGSPTLRDRVTASRMGYHAVELLRKGIYNRVVATKAESIVDYDISVALSPCTRPLIQRCWTSAPRFPFNLEKRQAGASLGRHPCFFASKTRFAPAVNILYYCNRRGGLKCHLAFSEAYCNRVQKDASYCFRAVFGVSAAFAVFSRTGQPLRPGITTMAQYQCRVVSVLAMNEAVMERIE